MPPIVDCPLADLEAPADLIISRVNSHDPERLVYLASLQLVPDQPIRLLSREPFEGPLRLRIARQEQVIGVELARVIRVSQVGR